MRIGILALQGGFIEHAEALKKAGAESFLIRQRRDLEEPIDGLILPGGESTVMSRLLHTRDLFTPLREKLLQGLPVFGTCAGLILLAREIEGEEQSHLGVLPLTVKRNGYGRQLGSFHTTGEFLGIGTVPMRFIRAPQITACDRRISIRLPGMME